MVSTTLVSPIHTDGTPAQLDDEAIYALQTSAPSDVPYFTPDLSQQYEDIITGVEPMSGLTSNALEYLNRWVMGKMSTTEAVANLDRIGWLEWVLPEEHLTKIMNGEFDNE